MGPRGWCCYMCQGDKSGLFTLKACPMLGLSWGGGSTLVGPILLRFQLNNGWICLRWGLVPTIYRKQTIAVSRQHSSSSVSHESSCSFIYIWILIFYLWLFSCFSFHWRCSAKRFKSAVAHVSDQCPPSLPFFLLQERFQDGCPWFIWGQRPWSWQSREENLISNFGW